MKQSDKVERQTIWVSYEPNGETETYDALVLRYGAKEPEVISDPTFIDTETLAITMIRRLKDEDKDMNIRLAHPSHFKRFRFRWCTHSRGVLRMLKTWTDFEDDGIDYTQYIVYGCLWKSIHPESAPDLARVSALLNGFYSVDDDEYYTYCATPIELQEEIIKKYDLVYLSGPEPAEQTV